MIIGTFEHIDGSYVGMIDTLKGSIAVPIRPQEPGLDYLVIAHGQGSSLNREVLCIFTQHDNAILISIALDMFVHPTID